MQLHLPSGSGNCSGSPALGHHAFILSHRTQSSICPPSTIYRLFELVFVFALLCFALFCCTFGTAAASALDFRFYLTLFAFSPSELTKLIFSQISFGFSLVFLVSLAACEVP